MEHATASVLGKTIATHSGRQPYQIINRNLKFFGISTFSWWSNSTVMDIVFLIVTKNNIKRPFGILPNVYNVKTAEAPDWTSRN